MYQEGWAPPTPEKIRLGSNVMKNTTTAAGKKQFYQHSKSP